MNTLAMIRRRQVRAQNGLCFYCRQPMWEGCAKRFASDHGLRGPRLLWLEATAEHLHARSVGGADTPGNIVAACRYCNAHRHRTPRPLPPDAYALKVRARLAAGRWHGLLLAGGEPAPAAGADSGPLPDRAAQSG